MNQSSRIFRIASFIFLILLFFTFPLFPQNTVIHPVVKEYELTAAQYKIWTEIKKEWFKNEYPHCLKKRNLKLTCAGCESIFIRIIFTINKNGILEEIENVSEKVCGGKADNKLKECFLKNFKTKIFPDELRNMKIEITLGTGLKC
jgi:hypothetical protein